MDKKVAARVLERDQHRCQFPTNDRKCGNSNIHLHHRLLRSQGGQDVDDNLIALCKNHHDWAHDNSEDARLLGLIIKTGDDPDRHH
jgi:predicted restriction endonuclease